MCLTNKQKNDAIHNKSKTRKNDNIKTRKIGNFRWINYLTEEELENMERFSYDGKIVRCRVCEIYDGETCSIVFKEGFELKKIRIRCLGYNSPEVRGKEKEEGYKAKKHFIKLLSKSRILIAHLGKFDNFGRTLVTFYYPYYFSHGKSINQMMIDDGFGEIFKK